MQPAYYYAQPVQTAYYPPQPGPYAQPAAQAGYYAQPAVQPGYYAPPQANNVLAQFHQVVEQALTALPLGTLPGDTFQRSPEAAAALPAQPAPAQPEPAKPPEQPEAAKPPEQPAPAATYTVQSGDSLSKIARAELGSADRWREIWELNQQQISNPNLILPGQVLKMPGGASAPAPHQPSPPAPAGSILARFTPEEVSSSLGAPLDNVKKYWPAIAQALEEAGITSNDAVTAVLATIKTEVGSFEPIPEYASGEAYNGRSDLGNTQPGDGPRYKGRGFIQLTGRANYRTYGKALGVDLEGNPDLALDPVIAAKVLVEYFKRRDIPEMAERHDWQDVRKAVNGGLNGYNTFIAAVNRLDDVAVA